MPKRILELALFAFFASTACSDDPEPGSFPECQAIAEACHAVDPGSGPIHDCHENAEEATTAQACRDISAGCLALCGAAADAGVADAG